MHSILAPIVSFFLSPYHWIILLLIAAYFFRRKKYRRSLWISALIIFIVFSNGWVLGNFARNFQPAPVKLTTGKVYSCGIVAGGFASPVSDGDGVFNSSADRFIQTLKLFKQGHITHIIVSGGNGKVEQSSFREGAFVKKELITMGVPDSVIFIEDHSDNTKENAANARQILTASHLQPPYLLISSAHHLPRALLLFQQAGVEVEPYPCNYIAGRGIETGAGWLPDFGVLQSWDTYLKEWVGFWWYS